MSAPGAACPKPDGILRFTLPTLQLSASPAVGQGLGESGKNSVGLDKPGHCAQSTLLSLTVVARLKLHACEIRAGAILRFRSNARSLKGK
jgi:hypothetical protein